MAGLPALLRQSMVKATVLGNMGNIFTSICIMSQTGVKPSVRPDKPTLVDCMVEHKEATGRFEYMIISDSLSSH